MQSRRDSSGSEYWNSLRSITSCAVLTLIAGAASNAQSTPSLNADPGVLAPIGVHVANRQGLRVFASEKSSHQAAPLGAYANEAKPQAIVRFRVRRPHTPRENEGGAGG